MVTKVRKVGNSLGITLPKEVIEQLNLKQGDVLTIDNRGEKLELKSVDSEFQE